MSTEETTRPARKRTPEEIEALRAKKRARMLAEAGENSVEEVKRKKRTPEEIEALRAKKRARMLAEAEAEKAQKKSVQKKRPRPVEDEEELTEVRRKKRPRPVEDDEELIEVRRKKRPRPVEDEEELTEVRRKKRPHPVEDEEEAAVTKRTKRTRPDREEELLPVSESPAPEPEEEEDFEDEEYEADLGEYEDEDDFDEDELKSAKRAKKKEHNYTWLLILLLVMLLAAMGAFAYLLTGTRAIGLGKESISMLLGDELTPEAEFTPSFARDKSYTLYTENPDIITVNGGNTLVAEAEGVATVTIVQNGIVFGSCTVTVGPVRVSGISVENAPESMIVGESFVPELKYVPENATHPELTLSVSDETIASLEDDTLTALAPGLLTLIVSNSHSGLTKEVEIAILPIEPETITLEMPETVSYGVDAEIEAVFEPEDTTDQELMFTSSDPAIIEIDGTAIVPKGIGTATVTAEHSSGLKVWKDVTVNPQVKIEGTNTLEVKKRQNLTLTIVPEGDAGKVEWTSSNEKVATVSNRGQVKGVGGGTAVITAKLESGAEGTFEVNVPAVVQKCRTKILVKGKASRNDVIEFMGMTNKNTVVKLECAEDPEKNCMLLIAKTGEMSTQKAKEESSLKGFRAKIPAATYNVKIAFGDTWYGDTLLFGESGEYYDLHLDYTTEKEGAFGISSLSRSGTKEVLTLEQFVG